VSVSSRALAIAAIVALGAACTSSTTPGRSGSVSASAAGSPATTRSTTPPPLASVHVGLEQIATLDQPLALATRSGDRALYIAEKTGRVVAIRDDRVDPTPVLDLSGDVSLGGEQGLLGIAFSPDGRSLYVNYTDVDGDTRVVAYAMGRRTAEPDTRRELLFVDQPYANHNGGDLVFGPDGYLYVGLGDGGSAGDPQGHAQSLESLLGKMLRIDPRPDRDRAYSIPPDNPFVDRDGARAEIWAYGLRNPWRYSFDRATGDLWIGDVGQNAWEEIDRLPAGTPPGANLGWNLVEGSRRFTGDPPNGAVAPVYEYPHASGACTVIGGVVYRGDEIPDLVGAYLFADLCLGELEAIRLGSGEHVDHAVLGPTVPNVGSFGEDAEGDVYALSLAGGVYRLTRG
jgi:glucose/arabinose dehydrogenase